MGKRELFLLLGFLVIGGLVYQVTAPAGESGGGRSWSDVLRNVRGEMFGSNARVGVDREVTAAVGPEVEVLDLGDLSGQVTIVGMEREDVSATLRVSLLGENEGEVTAAAAQLSVTAREDGDALKLSLTHPDAWRMGRGRIAADVKMEAPRRLRVRFTGRGTVNVRDMAGVDLEVARGTVTLANVAGPVTGQYRDGSLDIDGAASVDIETRRLTLKLSRIAGAIEVDGVDGQVKGAQLPGPVTLDLRRMLVDLDEVANLVEITAADGRADLRRLAGGVRANLERMPFSASLSRAADVDVEGADAPIELTLPAQGVALDVEAIDGSIEVPESIGRPVKDGTTQKLETDVKGGGPKVHLRGSRTMVVVKAP